MTFNIGFCKTITESIRKFLSTERGRKVFIAVGLFAMFAVLLSTVSCNSNIEQPAQLNSEQSVAEIEKQLERRIVQLVSHISGAGSEGEIEVMITLEATKASVYQKNESYETTNQTNSNGTTASKSKKTEVVLAGSNKQPLEIGTVQPEVRGVTVVCKGGENPLVRERITNAVAKALDIGLSRVCVTY